MPVSWGRFVVHEAVAIIWLLVVYCYDNTDFAGFVCELELCLTGSWQQRLSLLSDSRFNVTHIYFLYTVLRKTQLTPSQFCFSIKTDVLHCLGLFSSVCRSERKKKGEAHSFCWDCFVDLFWPCVRTTKIHGMSTPCLFREMSVETVQKNGIIHRTFKYYDNGNLFTASNNQCPTMCLLTAVNRLNMFL